MDFVGRINQLNNERGWNAYRLSVMSGIPQSTISAWYTRNMMPTIATIEKICEAYGITMSQFFAESGERLDLTPDQIKLLDQWDMLTPKDKEHLFTVMEWMQEGNEG